MFRCDWFCGFLAMLLCIGCGPRNNPTFEKTVPVRGTVLLADGSPLKGGRITFHPKDATKGDAWAMIGPDGRFELGTYKKDDGAMLGTYTVTVEPIVFDRRGNPCLNTYLGIPAKFTNTDSSGLVVEVKNEENQDLKLVLH